MRATSALLAFAVLALVLPSPASARGGGGGGGFHGGGGGGGGHAPAARSAAPRASSPSPRSYSPSPRVSSPSPRSYAPSTRASAPPSRSYGSSARYGTPSYRGTSTARRASSPAVRTAGGSSRGQGVLGGGQRSAHQDPSGGLRRSGSTSVRSGAPAARSIGTRNASAPGFSNPATGARSASSRSSGGLLDRTGDRVRSPGARSTGGASESKSGTPGFRGGHGGLLGDVSNKLHGRDRSGTGTGSGNGGNNHGGKDGNGGHGGKNGNDGHNDGHNDGNDDGHHDGHHSNDGDCHYDDHHGYYDDHGWGLTFSFGVGYGPYYGLSYYYPYHSYVYGADYAFFYPAPVTWAYVPYGFYTETTPVYVTRYEVVRETVPVYEYEDRKTMPVEGEGAGGAGPAAPSAAEAEVKIADPAPAAGSPATEKFLREASDHFRKKEYYEAAVKFRLAALSSPELSGPLFALGQSLVAMEQDAYAARVLRKAVEMSPKMLQETGDISGVWESPQEFDRVMKSLEARSAESPVDGDARFLLAAERYFAGDVRSREGFDLLHEARPMDEAVAHFRAAAIARFKSADELPAIQGGKPAK